MGAGPWWSASPGSSDRRWPRSSSGLGWETFGLSRSGGSPSPEITPVQADLSDPASLAARPGRRPAGAGRRSPPGRARRPRPRTSRVNGGTVRDLLAALEPAGSVRHVALMTGLKHYLGPVRGLRPGRHAGHAVPRGRAAAADSPNFYYAQEDELFAAAARDGFTWSVHRAHTIIGYAVGNAMNMGLTLARLRRDLPELGRPFVFPGSRDAVERRDRHDRRRPARRADASGPPRRRPADDQAFNIANGDVFRWRWLWPQLAACFGVEPEGFDERAAPAGGSRWPAWSRCGRDLAAAARPRRARPRRGSPRGGTPTATSAATSSAHRHEQEPHGRVPRVPGHARQLLRLRRAVPPGTDHPVRARAGAAYTG